MTLDEILSAFKSGQFDADRTGQMIRSTFFQDLGHSTLDNDRRRRNGAGEVIYGEHKTTAQILDLVTAMVDRGDNVLVTRTCEAVFDAVVKIVKQAEFHEQARLITCRVRPVTPASGTIAVVTAGTSDRGVAEEAALTAEFYGNPVARISDVGVAGIHRLLARLDVLREARVLIVVAGMEGALPSAVGGLVDKPVIAVPTSVGYGASFGGIAALLGMLNSCASGVSVVNIDNGFGAGYLASMMNRL
ncbi:MAG: nickel pincer cofactor biosynthesis protein LarB [Pseudomonadales bacterium]|nr:nickel pincer cofactor biosynthesis protein LarB [Pseudomonadales bacterium]